jgi:hypothetical protein
MLDAARKGLVESTYYLVLLLQNVVVLGFRLASIPRHPLDLKEYSADFPGVYKGNTRVLVNDGGDNGLEQLGGVDAQGLGQVERGGELEDGVAGRAGGPLGRGGLGGRGGVEGGGEEGPGGGGVDIQISKRGRGCHGVDAGPTRRCSRASVAQLHSLSAVLQIRRHRDRDVTRA